MLGVKVDPAYVKRLEATLEAKAEARRRRREKEREARELEQKWAEDGSDTFAYIAGHTAGGAPHGVTWEEMGEKSRVCKYEDDSC